VHHEERFVVFSKGICRRRGKPRRGEEKKVCCSSIESADVMRSSADDPFFRFFNSLLETKTKTFLMKKEKRTGRSFSLHTDVFLEKNHCRNTYISAEEF
jgi:hypothetical protein